MRSKGCIAPETYASSSQIRTDLELSWFAVLERFSGFKRVIAELDSRDCRYIKLNFSGGGNRICVNHRRQRFAHSSKKLLHIQAHKDCRHIGKVPVIALV